jgi:hypothetical protein
MTPMDSGYLAVIWSGLIQLAISGKDSFEL